METKPASQYNLNSIWNEKNFSDASEEITKLLEQAKKVVHALEKLDDDSDLVSFKGKLPSEIEAVKKSLTKMIESKWSKSGLNFLASELKSIAENVILWEEENK